MSIAQLFALEILLLLAPGKPSAAPKESDALSTLGQTAHHDKRESKPTAGCVGFEADGALLGMIPVPISLVGDACKEEDPTDVPGVSREYRVVQTTSEAAGVISENRLHVTTRDKGLIAGYTIKHEVCRTLFLATGEPTCHGLDTDNFGGEAFLSVTATPLVQPDSAGGAPALVHGMAKLKIVSKDDCATYSDTTEAEIDLMISVSMKLDGTIATRWRFVARETGEPPDIKSDDAPMPGVPGATKPMSVVYPKKKPLPEDLAVANEASISFNASAKAVVVLAPAKGTSRLLVRTQLNSAELFDTVENVGYKD